MDVIESYIDLLNPWIERLDLHIHENTLRLQLKSHTNDHMMSYTLPLSSNPVEIFAFLGYDTAVRYSDLTEKNKFEYLCTSKILHPKYIVPLGDNVKRGYKNKVHKRYDEYLSNKQYPKFVTNIDGAHLEHLKKDLRKRAIAFFHKENEIETYISQYKLMNKLFEQRDKIPKDSFYDFNKFVVLHGIKSIVGMQHEEFCKEWKQFIDSNWSQLNMFCWRTQ
jgi:hypothetical protein